MRWALVAALLWLGMLLTLAFLAAPSAFAVLPREQAGMAAGRFFRQEAYASMALGMLLLVCLQSRAGDRRRDSSGRARTDMALALGAMLCTLAGYFALQPVMALARAGQAAWSFAALHGVSMAFFAVKTGLVAALGWRLSAPPAPR